MDHPAAVLAVGRVRRPHGVHGEVIVDVHTDFPERLTAGMEVSLGTNGPARVLKIHRLRMHKGAWLIAFEGPTTRNDAEDLRDLWVFLPPQPRSELPPTYYYEHELAGLRCVTAAGRELGTVKALLPGGAGGLLEVETPAGGALVPFVSPIVVGVDLEAGTVVLDPPAGLLDGDAL